MVLNEHAIWTLVFEVNARKKKSLLLLMNIITQPTERSCPRGLDCMKLFQYSLIQPLSPAPSLH